MVIQKQLLMFVIHLLLRNLQGHDLQQALHTLITPLVTNVITPTSPSQMSSRRTFTFRQSTTSSPSVVVSSLYIRSIYLLTAVVKVSYTANKAVRDVLYPDLISVLTAVIQNLCGCFDRSDSSNSFENCRLMWNFVLYTSSVLRGHKAVYPSFLPLVGNVLQHLPSLASQISNSVKSVMCWYCRKEIIYRWTSFIETPSIDISTSYGTRIRYRYASEYCMPPCSSWWDMHSFTKWGYCRIIYKNLQNCSF